MHVSRRRFLQLSSAFAGVNFLPSRTWAESPMHKVNVAHIGVGQMGRHVRDRIGSHPQCNIVAVCDVDRNALNHHRGGVADDRVYADYRVMLDELGDQIDAVSIATPDHMHAPISMLAMAKGKHVFCEKPLGHNIGECYQMAKMADENPNLHTQMGIQCHSSEAYMVATDFLRQGAIGKVSKVYVWTHKNWGHDGGRPEGDGHPVPPMLDWNLWLGVAPEQPFWHRRYHPGQWRRYMDFGCGALGDMGVHIFDTPMHALGLGFAESVKTTCREPDGYGHPTSNIMEFVFTGTEYTADKVAFTWFDGAYGPPDSSNTPDLQLPDDRKLPGEGAMFIGEDGKRMLLPHHTGPQLLPGSLIQNISRRRIPGMNHYHLWVNAILGNGQCNTPFSYSSILTANMLMGIVGSHFPGETLNWDTANMRFSNKDAANQWISREYRAF
jgi:predicted dehydrogenase